MSLRLRADGQEFVTVVAHTPYDSLRDLVLALACLTDADCFMTVKWNSEPDEYDFNFMARDAQAQLDVLHHPDHRRIADDASLVFSFRGPKAELCRAFWQELQDLRSRTEQDEFDRQWRRDFPEAEMEKLTKKINLARR